jgi:Tetratricopeptide repeat/NB-ARC domain
MPRTPRLAPLLTVCAALLTVALAIAINVATGGTLPSSMQSYEPWAWPVVGLLTLATITVGVLQLRDTYASADLPSEQRNRTDVADSGAVAQRDLHISGQHAAGRDIHITYNTPVPTSRPDPRTDPISNLPPRNPNFTGRVDLLDALRQQLSHTATTAVVADQAPGQVLHHVSEPHVLYGLGGVGKTQLALEYAHRHEGDYDIRWWIPAEQPLAISASLAALGRRLGLPDRAQQEEQVADVLADLNRRDRWLLVFDNAIQAHDFIAYRPSTNRGHILITSRNPAWGEIAEPIRVTTFTRDEAVAFLLRRSHSNDHSSAGHLAEELGELPLALEQAVAYLEQTAVSLDEYLTLYRHNREALLDKGGSITYGGTIDATFRLAYQQVAKPSKAAAELLTLCAFLAPEQIPHNLLRKAPDRLPEGLAGVVEDDGRYTETVGILRGYSLVERDQIGLRVHRLVQAVTRQQLLHPDRAEWAGRAVKVVQASWPVQSRLPAAWPSCEVLLPHAMAAIEHAQGHDKRDAAVGRLLYEIGLYLGGRGELQGGKQCLEGALGIYEAVFGPNHPKTLTIRHEFARSAGETGDAHQALQLYREVLAARERTLTPDHPDLLSTRHEVARLTGEMGDAHQALQLFREVLAAREQTLGPNHPNTLATRHNVAYYTGETGDAHQALQLFREVLAAREQTLGPNHPSTVVTRHEVARLTG